MRCLEGEEVSPFLWHRQVLRSHLWGIARDPTIRRQRPSGTILHLYFPGADSPRWDATEVVVKPPF
jgi:hypothetical protein